MTHTHTHTVHGSCYILSYFNKKKNKYVEWKREHIVVICLHYAYKLGTFFFHVPFHCFCSIILYGWLIWQSSRTSIKQTCWYALGMQLKKTTLDSRPDEFALYMSHNVWAIESIRPSSISSLRLASLWKWSNCDGPFPCTIYRLWNIIESIVLSSAVYSPFDFDFVFHLHNNHQVIHVIA